MECLSFPLFFRRYLYERLFNLFIFLHYLHEIFHRKESKLNWLVTVISSIALPHICAGLSMSVNKQYGNFRSIDVTPRALSVSWFSFLKCKCLSRASWNCPSASRNGLALTFSLDYVFGRLFWSSLVETGQWWKREQSLIFCIILFSRRDPYWCISARFWLHLEFCFRSTSFPAWNEP